MEVLRAAEPAEPAAAGVQAAPQEQQWEAAAGGAPLTRSQSETRRGGAGLEWAQGAGQPRVEPRAWSIAY